MTDNLPPLPEKAQIDKHIPTGIVLRGYTAEQMQAYARAAIERQSVPAGYVPVPTELTEYDAGLLNDFGGGDVEWWQDYIRAELGRAYEHYQSQIPAQGEKQ